MHQRDIIMHQRDIIMSKVDDDPNTQTVKHNANFNGRIENACNFSG